MASSHGKIAIIGMACRFPGGAHHPEEFWNLLKSGESTMEEIPQSRFKVDDYWCKDGTEVNKMAARRGHFLREGDLFDEKFFSLSPREAVNTDPQHRILLECVVDALDDAGYKPINAGGEQGWDNSRMGVFVGSATDSYQNNLASDIDAFFCPGTIRGFASGRISHHFGFQGPSIVYDTACSSGLVAVHSACQSLLLNECDAAIASGTNMLTSPEMFIGLSKGFFVSHTGGCRTFDETGDGYCRAEGVGVLVLKRLDDAVRDRDKVDAIIVASGTNQSGPAESLTTPHAPTQSMLFEANCKKASISPLAIRAVEAHGTGTQAGDYAEIEAIKKSFCHARPKGDTTSALFVSSLKPNIGHSESTSGIASVIKAVLMMKHGMVPPHIGISTRLNPRLGDLAANGIIIPRKQHPLHPITGYSNVFISVNNFGAPGGNANVILQDAPGGVLLEPKETDPRTQHIVTLSAQTHTPFQSIINAMLDRLEEVEEADLPSLSYTTTVRRVDYSTRLAFNVSSIEELKQQLQKATSPITVGVKPASIGFVIAGNGSQFQGMAKVLYRTSPVFRAGISRCNGISRDVGGPEFLGVITGELDPLNPHYNNFLCGALSVFSVAYATGIMWREWGVNPSVILGHSFGEIAAFVLAGCLSVEDAIQVIIWRTEALFANEAVPEHGGMLVIGISEIDVERILRDSGCSGLVISCYNGPAQTCVSGPKDQLSRLQEFAQALPQPPLTKVLQSRFPWHSPILIDAARHFQTKMEGIVFRPAKISLILNISGSVLLPGEIPSSSYLAEQVVQPVRFDLCVNNPLAQNTNIWIELGAKSLLLPLLRAMVPLGVSLLPTMSSANTDCWLSITKALARLYEAQVPIKWAAYHKPYQHKLLALPRYPFARNKHWVEYQDRLHQTRYSTPDERSSVNHQNILTPMGPLEIIEPWRRYRLCTSGQHLHLGVYIWLVLKCTKGTSTVTDFQVTPPTAQGSYLTILVGSSSPVQQIISFVQHDSEHTLENGVTVANCKIESGSFITAPHTEKVLQRSRTKLLNDSGSSFFSKAVVSKLLMASLEGTGSGQTVLESFALSDDGIEAVGQIHWGDEEAFVDRDHPFLSSVAFSPSQAQSLFQPACLAMFLNSGTASPNSTYIVDRVDFTQDFHKNLIPSGKEGLCVHVFIDDVSNSPESGNMNSQSHIYSRDGSALACISGLRKFVVRNSMNNRTQLSLEVPGPQPDKNLPQMIAPSILTPPDSTIREETIRSLVEQESERAFTKSVIIDVLSQELGVPAHSIAASDKLEDLGVDSIMSLLLRDKLRLVSGRPLKWFHWKRGITVEDLSNHIFPL